MTDLPFERCADCETVCAGCRFARATRGKDFLEGVGVGLALGLAILLASCTVTPRQVVSHSPSLDGTNLNSGLIGFGATGDCVLTEHAKQRYDSLVRRFGDQFEVPIREGEGLTQTNGYWILREDRCADFETMTRWSR